MKKYLVIPGYVKSETDGEEHYVSCSQLCRLYKVNPAECIFIKDDNDWRWLDTINPKDWITLTPRYDGNYSLPERL